MRTLCNFLGFALFVVGFWIWVETPSYSIERDLLYPIAFYRIATISSFLGGIFWFALATILGNQEEIKKKLGITEDKQTDPPFNGKVF